MYLFIFSLQINLSVIIWCKKNKGKAFIYLLYIYNNITAMLMWLCLKIKKLSKRYLQRKEKENYLLQK